VLYIGFVVCGWDGLVCRFARDLSWLVCLVLFVWSVSFYFVMMFRFVFGLVWCGGVYV